MKIDSELTFPEFYRLKAYRRKLVKGRHRQIKHRKFCASIKRPAVQFGFTDTMTITRGTGLPELSAEDEASIGKALASATQKHPDPVEGIQNGQ